MCGLAGVADFGGVDAPSYTPALLRSMTRTDARSRGETHQWMWDRVSLPHGLEVAGFSDPRVLTNTGSQIPDWGGLPRRDARRAGVQARLALRRSPEVELAHKHHSQLPHPGRILPLGDQ